ncbi:hypothetical protein ACFQ8C_21165 [Streptomyces sp. NPDC056503]|uniref:hypothetical protein n=1 Tax=Streptomyces sp. NPDC056503 TaxID=3345842 RepID=UPI003694840B
MARRRDETPEAKEKRQAAQRSLAAIQEAAGQIGELTPYLRERQVRRALADGRVPAVKEHWWPEVEACRRSSFSALSQIL